MLVTFSRFDKYVNFSLQCLFFFIENISNVSFSVVRFNYATGKFTIYIIRTVLLIIVAIFIINLFFFFATTLDRESTTGNATARRQTRQQHRNRTSENPKRGRKKINDTEKLEEAASPLNQTHRKYPKMASRESTPGRNPWPSRI